MGDERWANATRTKEAMTALLSHFGWRMLEEVLKEKESILLGDLLDPGKEITDEKLREMRMAVINLRMATSLPHAMLEVANETIKEFADLDKEASDVEAEVEEDELPEGSAP